MSAGLVVVVGFGVTGKAVAMWARNSGRDVLVLDDRADAESIAAAKTDGVDLVRTPAADADLGACLAEADLVVPSPGVPVSHPIYRVAERLGLPVRSEIELASEVCASSPGTRLIAITGTNGKTTVTTLVTAILQAAGFRAVAAGNIGVPLIDAVTEDHQFVVAEVSSFQLQFTEHFRPLVSCWLNLAPDHLDWHPDMDHYAAAKSRIWRNQGAGDRAVFNADDPTVVENAAAIPDGVARMSFSTTAPALFTVAHGELTGPGPEPIMPLAELPRALPHDVANSLAAAAVALAAGADAAACRSALAATRPLPHRVALVASAAGVDWYDDSKATTPASVLAAVAGFDSVVLIAGGRNKGLDLSVLRAAVPPIRAAVAIGDAADEVVEALGSTVEVVVASTMDEAVSAAARLSEPGDSVLLSPGCASFDWYRSYSERGDDFARAVALQTQQSQGETPC